MSVCRCITGIVVEEGTAVGQAGLVVQAGTTGLGGFRSVAWAQTRADGRFSIDLGAFIAEGASASEWVLRVCRGVDLLESHGDTRWSEGRDAHDLVLCIVYPQRCATPDPVGAGENPTTGIHGLVRHTDGTPVQTRTVKCFVVGIAGETELSTGTTTNDGWYNLTGPSSPADIVVKVYDTGPRLVGSRVRYGAGSTLRVDLDICDDALRGPSEYARINTALDPLRGATAPASIGIVGMAWLSGRSSWPLERVVDWVLARRFGVSMGVDPEPLYGLVREGFPRTADGILARPASAVTRALKAAWRKNIIDYSVNIPAFVASLATPRAAALDDGAVDSIGSILRTSHNLGQPQGLSDTQVLDFCDLYAASEGTDSAFWSALADEGSYTDDAVAEAARLVALGTIGLSHAPCVQAILGELGTGAPTALAAWDGAAWDRVVGLGTPSRWPGGAPLPVGLDGSTEAAQRAALAVLLRENAQGTYRTETIRSALGTGVPGLPGPVAEFFSLPGNAAIDLETAKLTASTVDASTTEAQLDAARLAQRLYRIAPSTDATTAMGKLAAIGISSARDVARMGRARFTSSYASGGTSADLDAAVEIHQKATSQAGMAAAVYLQAHPSLTRLNLAFVPDDPAITATIDEETVPGWSGLFGDSSSGCACAWCRSIHGPAAYLVDLLHWLATKTAPAGSSGPATALAALSDRRPDLVGLKLSCENTTRVLPYIDLSLEVLEGVVAGGVVSLVAQNSDVATEEQLAAPQYVNTAAYDAGNLGDATNSPQVPFHRALVEMRPYLQHLGLDRTDLMRTFGEVLDVSIAPTARHIAVEELGLSVEAAVVIESPQTTTGAEGAYWSISDLTIRPSVRALRRATETDYSDILDLLHARSVNPGALLGVSIEGSAEDAGSYLIGQGTSAPGAGQWSAMRQVLRLWRATGWTLFELDSVLVALGSNPSTPATWSTTTPIEGVGDVHRLARLTSRSALELASWFGDVDTWADRTTKEAPVASFWDQTWLSPSLFPVAEASATGFPFLLNTGRTEVANPSLLLADHTAKLAAVLATSQDEVLALTVALEDDLAPGGSDPTVTRANLSLLYRWASLARVLGLRPTEAVRFSEMSGLDPFSLPADALAFVEVWREVAAAGWSVDELDYLVRHRATERVGPTDERLRSVLGRLRALVKTLAGRTEAEQVEALTLQLAADLGVDRALVDAADAGMWCGAPDAGSSAFLTLAASIAASDAVTLPATPTAVTLAVTLAAEAATATGTVAQGTAVVLQPGSVVSVAAGELDTDAPLTPVSRNSFVQSSTRVTVVSGDFTVGATTYTLTSSVAADAAGADVAAVGLARPAPAVAGLLTRFTRSAFASSASSDASDPDADLTRATFATDFAVVEALHKAAWLTRKLVANAAEVTAWGGRIDDWALLAPGDLTSDSLEGRSLGDGEESACWRALTTIRLFAQRNRLPGSEPTFAAVVTDPSSTNIAARTGWDTTTMDTLVGWMGTASVGRLKVLLDRAEVVRRSGADAATVASWAAAGTLVGSAPGITADTSRTVIAAARSRYPTPEGWAAVARPLRDPVRKKQRDALVSFLIASAASDDIVSADDLYETYLIDVSMNPEMLTSRVKQAACSVQLFVHRCLFGLENNGSYDLGDWFNDDDRAEWEWMRTYRVWEAARKVFLYPENWIEPELRDDKTPFFRTLEKELAQGDVTADRAEGVLLDYLDRLHEVASLRVLATYVQNESDADGTTDVVHVFARTAADPPTYWYRRREDQATWTAWEKIDCGVSGDHLIPAIYNRRLLLFWGEFTRAQSEAEKPTVTAWWDVRLAMSEYRSGRWSPKRLGTDALSLGSSALLPYGLNLGSRDRYGFNLNIDETANTVSLVLFGGVQPSVLSTYTEFTQLGTFTLDPCTLEITPSASVATPISRPALDQDYWKNPGRWTFDYDENLERNDHLAVNLGPADEAGEPDGSYGAVSVLGSLPDGSVVVPGQWTTFVSQSSFFVSVGSRVFFVEPSEGLATVEVPPGEEFAGGTFPSVSAIADLRSGTTGSSGSTGTSLSDDEVVAYSEYLDASAYPSAAAAADAIRAADEARLAVSDNATLTTPSGGYLFSNFYHPHVCRFIREVRRNGVFGLLDPDPAGTAADLVRQELVGTFDFEAEHAPTERVALPYPVENIDFSDGGAYSQYNWEVFFHLPYYVGSRLADAGRFDDALDWLHAVFDPRTRSESSALTTSPDANSRWWKVRPFLTSASASVDDWITFSGASTDAASAAAATAQAKAFERQVAAWRADPFNPHLLARLRPGTYQKAFVMRYLDTLIGWGDQLFASDTIESINEATQLYVFAKKVLGDRPESLGSGVEPSPQSYTELSTSLDAFGNALVAIENASASATGCGTSDAGTSLTAGLGYATYFCIPRNAKLVSYWDTVEDRLFKVRNGMNLAGVIRSLPLFEPPIDPAMLVRASAAGLDISAIANGTVDVPAYRFSVMLARAQALAGSVRALGGALLSALEKRDGEALALLRQTHEETTNASVVEVREQQLEEARTNKQALKKQRKLVEARLAYYEGLILKMFLANEITAGEEVAWAVRGAGSAAAVQGIAALLSWIPEASFGPFISGVTFGGGNVSNALSATSSAISIGAGALQTEAGRLTTVASYQRRTQEWMFQRISATKELDQLDKQIEAADIRVEISRRELTNQRRQVAHSSEVREWMERKFTAAELYDWTASELATLHFQTYQLAVATAQKAERCYQHELGRSAESFVQLGHWDGSRRGLLAGERLAADLERMDQAYLEHDAREHELTKPVSLARLDPVALARLRAEGECYFAIPEAAFDLDTPGHYLRRIQSVALTIAATAGQQGTVSAQLTLHGARVRWTPAGTVDAESFTPLPSIVTSVAIQDAGLFQTDLRDPRYLPFERRGAISQWHLKLTAQVVKQVEWDSITDVVLHLRYTAQYDSTLADTRESAMDASLTELLIGHEDASFIGTDFQTSTSGTTEGGATFLLSAKRDDPDGLYAAQQDATATSLDFEVTEAMLGGLAERTLLAVVAIATTSVDASNSPVPANFAISGYTTSTAPISPTSGLTLAIFTPSSPPSSAAATYTVALGNGTSGSAAHVSDLDDLALILVLK